MADFERLARERAAREAAAEQQRIKDATRANEERQSREQRIQVLRQSLFSNSGAQKLLTDYQKQILKGLGTITDHTSDNSSELRLHCSIPHYIEDLQEELSTAKGRYTATLRATYTPNGDMVSGAKSVSFDGPHTVVHEVVRGAKNDDANGWRTSLSLGIRAWEESSFSLSVNSKQERLNIPLDSPKAASITREFYTDELTKQAMKDRSVDPQARLRDEEARKRTIERSIGSRRPVELTYFATSKFQHGSRGINTWYEPDGWERKRK